MQVAEVDAVDRGGKEVLLHVARPDGSLRPDLEGPTMTRSSLVHRGTLDALVQSTDEERKGSSAGMAGASDALGIHLRPCQEIVDGAHAIPDAVLGEVLADQEQQMAGHIVFPRHRASDLALVRVRIPVVSPLALSDRIVSQHDES